MALRGMEKTSGLSGDSAGAFSTGASMRHCRKAATEAGVERIGSTGWAAKVDNRNRVGQQIAHPCTFFENADLHGISVGTEEE